MICDLEASRNANGKGMGEMGRVDGKRVLITGSTGFIGSNLARKCLDLGADVYLLTRSTSDKWRVRDILAKVRAFDVDLSDRDKLEKIVIEIQPEIVFHTAAYGGDPAQKDLMAIFRSNFLGTANLVDSCKTVDLELFVNTGSSSEYGVKAAPMKEDDLLEPANDYGISKSAATMYCQAAARNDELPIITLRLFSPYGSFESPARLIPSVILACLRDERPRIASRSFVRDFVFIGDVMDAYLIVTESKNLGGKIFNIGSGKQHSVGDVVDMIIKLTGAQVEPEIGGPSRWKTEPCMWQADISRARDCLGWRPKYELKRGLAASIDWFRENMDIYRPI